MQRKSGALYLNKIIIEKEKQGDKEYFKIQNTKMKLLLDKSYSEASISITVDIPIPEVDIGSGDVKSSFSCSHGKKLATRNKKWPNRTAVL